ncbi:hypothetical protein ANCCAN_12306 [Ancylostoma caninum]|uniref:Uncharacterized protein n=1 Tax=Ancylostoma caninum TaxID=29170 RepID=A0A368GBF1_ANCCA|nr:hypothetical protein ANCCAN_12306 [Ancylostoma caninum]
MVKAVKSGATDGIGLARPVTAEPDLPLKILSGFCHSATDTKVNPDDFIMTFLVSTSQISQMGRLPTSVLTSICEGIADLSIQEEAENFKERAAEWILETRKNRDSKKPAPEVFHYKSLF